MKKPLILLALAPLALSFAAPLQAQTLMVPAASAPSPASAPSAETEAMALLDKSAAAYAALDGLSMKYSVFNNEGAKTSTRSGLIAFEKSGAARISQTLTGPNIVMSAAGDAESAKKSLASAMARIPSGASIPLSSLAQGKNPLRESTIFGSKAIFENIRLLPDNGVGVRITDPRHAKDAFDLAFYFDASDNLLRRVEAKGTVNGKSLLDLTTLSDIRINPQFAPDTFVSPPAPKPNPRRDPDVYWDPKLKVGAAPFALTGADFGGKTRDLSAYKGKVVLLDFWATWCGPCVGELPNVLSNYKKYHAKNFEIVGVSLDEDKKSLTDFVRARQMPWPQLFDGKGWKNQNATRFAVHAIPFTLLIGKDGKIAAVNPRGEELEPALKAALAK